ncbi:uncharacterized protein [Diadema antillarum]|uniref:uncharacterized protein n=1 Tax=Diadema antillarum TaxID=105358 RepID=UPI003A8358A2
MDDDDDCAFVVDLGSGLCKAGFSGDESPRFSIPSIVGKKKYEKLVPFNVDDDSMSYLYVGDGAQCRRGLLRLRHPIDHGVIANWDDLELLLKNIFYNKLRCGADELPVLLTEATMSPKSQKEKLAEVGLVFNVLAAFRKTAKPSFSAGQLARKTCPNHYDVIRRKGKLGREYDM